MSLTSFDLPTKSKLPKIIGVLNHQLYVFVHDEKLLEIWSMNLFIPNSWQKQWQFEFAEIAYSSSTVMAEESCIYILFTGCYVGDEKYCLDILRLDVDKKDYIRYTSSDSSSVFELSELYDIHFETDTLCCGEKDLYIYDRGMVAGSIPFTRFILDHEQKTFAGTREPIPSDDPNIQPTIFGSLIHPDQKQFVKLGPQNTLRTFNKDLEKWVEFTQSREDSDVYLNELITRHTGIGVTYNQEHTRFAIVSSPIKLVTGDGTCLLVYKYSGRVLFFRVLFNQETQQFSLKKVGRITHRISQGYMFCDSQQLIVLSRPSYFLPLNVLSLKEISFKTAAQDLFEDLTDDGPIRKACGITHENSLI